MQVAFVEGEVPAPCLFGFNLKEVPRLDVSPRWRRVDRGGQLIQVLLEKSLAGGTVTDAEGEALDPLTLFENELEVLPFVKDELSVERHVLQAVGLTPGDSLDVDPGLGAGAPLVLILPGTFATALPARVPGTLDRRSVLGPLALDLLQGGALGETHLLG